MALHNYMNSLEIFKQCANVREKKEKKRTINLILKKCDKAVLSYNNLMLLRIISNALSYFIMYKQICMLCV